MARRHEARDYLLEGLTPQQIAQRMGVSLSTVRQYLYTVLSEGTILRTDITLSISEEDREYIEDVIRSNGLSTSGIHSAIYRKNHTTIPQEVISLYMCTRDPRPDLYAMICDLEVIFHKLVKQVLVDAYGDDWWRKGLPNDVRKGCQTRREDDEAPIVDLYPYQYTNFIDLKTIIEKQWAILPQLYRAILLRTGLKRLVNCRE